MYVFDKTLEAESALLPSFSSIWSDNALTRQILSYRSIYLSIYLSTNLCVCPFLSAYAFMHMHVCICGYARMRVCMQIRMYECMYICTDARARGCMHVCMHALYVPLSMRLFAVFAAWSQLICVWLE